MKFNTIDEVKAAYPINSYINIRGETIQITGYYYDSYYWWPINVTKGLTEKIKEAVLKGDLNV